MDFQVYYDHTNNWLIYMLYISSHTKVFICGFPYSDFVSLSRYTNVLFDIPMQALIVALWQTDQFINTLINSINLPRHKGTRSLTILIMNIYQKFLFDFNRFQRILDVLFMIANSRKYHISISLDLVMNTYNCFSERTNV